MDLPDTIKLIDACPHDWLFPRCSAVCHHGTHHPFFSISVVFVIYLFNSKGGAGTTAIGLKCGLPTVIVFLNFFNNMEFELK